MQVHRKPRISGNELSRHLGPHWPQPITHLTHLVEGEDSQAFRFQSGGSHFIVRINKSDYGFKKDAYAFKHFASAAIPIPEVLAKGRLDDEHYFCVAQFIDGPTLQDLDEPDVKALLPKVLELQKAIAAVDVGSAPRFGEFDTTGEAHYSSWHGWLLSHLSKPNFDWEHILTKELIERTFLEQVFETFRSLVAQVPKERKLFHGDFGSNNLLTQGGQVAAVLDWDAAGYGDWLFDVAGAYYWRHHLVCMRLAAEYYEQELADLTNYRERIKCYQLRAALIEIYVQANRGESQKLDYHVQRTKQLLADS